MAEDKKTKREEITELRDLIRELRTELSKARVEIASLVFRIDKLEKRPVIQPHDPWRPIGPRRDKPWPEPVKPYRIPIDPLRDEPFRWPQRIYCSLE